MIEEKVEATLETLKQESLPQDPFKERFEAILQALTDKGLDPSDNLTLQAIGATLVSAVVMNRGDKKAFFGYMRDLWRRAIIHRENGEISQDAPPKPSEPIATTQEEPKASSIIQIE